MPDTSPRSLAATPRAPNTSLAATPRAPNTSSLGIAREKLLNTEPMADRELLRLERRVLARCLRAGKLQYAEFGAGETLLILPTGGHAVLTGRRKVVVAGEWHLCPPARSLAAKLPVQCPRPPDVRAHVARARGEAARAAD